MTDPRHGRIVVELELDERDGLAGTVALEGGDATGFSGWIGLFAALEGSVERMRGGVGGAPAEGT